MASNFTVKPPAWFWIVAMLLLLWNAFGCFMFVQQIRLGSEAWNDPANAEYNRALYASLPGWLNYAYALGVGGGLLGALALLLRKRAARVLFVLSLIGVIAQFGYSLFATDLIAHKGAAMVLPVPVTIFLVALFSIWLAGLAGRRGWLR